MKKHAKRVPNKKGKIVKKHKIQIQSWEGGLLNTIVHWMESIEASMEMVGTFVLGEILGHIKVYDEYGVLVHEHKHMHYHHDHQYA